MTRRDAGPLACCASPSRTMTVFLAVLAACSAGPPSAAAGGDRPGASRLLLSTEGCGRATGYAEANKIVTANGKTHVAWLDSSSAGFRVRIRTLAHETGRWSPVYTIGEAYDNHGGPAVAIDSRGFLHVAYYPHHHPMRYRRSRRPHDASEWTEVERFGTRCTYPTLVVGPDDSLYLTCRESTGKQWVANLYVRKPAGAWRRVGSVLRSRFTGYAHFQEALAWGPGHKTLHLSCRIYEGPNGRCQTVGYLRSRDFGRSWRRADGQAVTLPATAETVDVIHRLGEAASVAGGQSVRCGAVAISAWGVPHILYSTADAAGGDLLLAWPGADGRWRRRSIGEQLAGALGGWLAKMPGGLSFDAEGRLWAVATMCRPGPDRKGGLWGHPTNEVAWLRLGEGGKMTGAALLTVPDAARARWLPNVERPTGFNRVERPGILYTDGPRGGKNTERLANTVYWVRPSQAGG